MTKRVTIQVIERVGEEKTITFLCTRLLDFIFMDIASHSRHIHIGEEVHHQLDFGRSSEENWEILGLDGLAICVHRDNDMCTVTHTNYRFLMTKEAFTFSYKFQGSTVNW